MVVRSKVVVLVPSVVWYLVWLVHPVKTVQEIAAISINSMISGSFILVHPQYANRLVRIVVHMDKILVHAYAVKVAHEGFQHG